MDQSTEESQVGSAGRSARKRKAIVDAAVEIFLRSGYLGTSMDEVAALSEVSKQTVYKHFSSKEALFIEIVTSMTNAVSDSVHVPVREPGSAKELPTFLRNYALRQLTAVMTPRILQLRRLGIAEAPRFPDLGKALYDCGPARAIDAIAALFAGLMRRGFLVQGDPKVVAANFNWLVMSDPLNRVMFLGDAAIPSRAELERHVGEAVRVFLAAYGKK
jgi:TetR/AcrR family transcriptional regulator, mexJK operon transcriptional repressor